MKQFNRMIIIVLDSVGIGAAADADKFDDVGSDTLGHIAHSFEGQWAIPHLAQMGLNNIRTDNPLESVPLMDPPVSYYGKMQEVSAGKDSMDGHWEMMGVPVKYKLDTFPNGFPQWLIQKISEYAQRPVIVNRPYSGTEVIRDYGEQQLQDGSLIVYTSGDSVLQIAVHEDVMNKEELYQLCRFVRKTVDASDLKIGRIIARPYKGSGADNFERTSDRHDFTMTPQTDTALDLLAQQQIPVVGIGKINDIFSGRGISEQIHTISNEDGMEQVIATVKKANEGLIFANLVDFDAKYGHRRNPQAYGEALMRTDQQIGELIRLLKNDDLLIITADHGNDPTFKGTDHTREFVPLLAYAPSLAGGNLGTRKTFSDLGKTVLDNFEVANNLPGTSFLPSIQVIPDFCTKFK